MSVDSLVEQQVVSLEEKYPVRVGEELSFQNDRPIIPRETSNEYREGLAGRLTEQARSIERSDLVQRVAQIQEQARPTAPLREERPGRIQDATILEDLHRVEADLLGVTPNELDWIIDTEYAQRMWGVAPKVTNDDYTPVFERRASMAEALGRYGAPGERNRVLHAIAFYYTAGWAEFLDNPGQTNMVDHVAAFANDYYDTLIRERQAFLRNELRDIRELGDHGRSWEVALTAVVMDQFNQRAGSREKLVTALSRQGKFGQTVLRAFNAVRELREKAPGLFPLPPESSGSASTAQRLEKRDV